MLPAEKAALAGIRAFTLDIDGTILDTQRDLEESLDEAIRRRGIAPPPRPEPDDGSIRTFQLQETVRHALGHTASDAEVARLIAEFRAIYATRLTCHTKPFPGVRLLMTVLERQGIRMGIVTNKLEVLAVPLIEHFFPGVPFTAVIGSIPPRPLKPDPTMLHMMAERMRLSCKQIALMGDSESDMLGARRAGMLPIGVTTGGNSRAQLLKMGAALVVEDLPAFAGTLLINRDQ